jgi:hypothetical protein
MEFINLKHGEPKVVKTLEVLTVEDVEVIQLVILG